jgi:hypothetical protein
MPVLSRDGSRVYGASVRRNELKSCCLQEFAGAPAPRDGVLGICSTCSTVVAYDGSAWFYDPASDTFEVRRDLRKRR